MKNDTYCACCFKPCEVGYIDMGPGFFTRTAWAPCSSCCGDILLDRRQGIQERWDKRQWKKKKRREKND